MCAFVCLDVPILCGSVIGVCVCVGGGLSYMREFCLWFCVYSGFVREV